jgi:putative DNA primase/helicase
MLDKQDDRLNGKVKLSPSFNDLINPDAIVNHIEQLKGKIETATPHAEILNQLIEQFEPLDFEVLANPHNAENFKLNAKHFLVLSIENALRLAEMNRWGLCKNHDFIYLYNSTFWAEIDKETFQKFLGEAAERQGVNKISAKF